MGHGFGGLLIVLDLIPKDIRVSYTKTKYYATHYLKV
jgi:hypothetical protein